VVLININKKLTNNDLGLNGSHHSVILVLKRNIKRRFFSFLGPDLYNSREKIDFLMNGKYYVLNYIFYNSKIHEIGMLNEYYLVYMLKFFREFALKKEDAFNFRYNNIKENYEIVIIPNLKKNNLDKQPLTIKAGWYSKEVAYGNR